ncbi:MAG: hypothetical protein IJW63_01855 [Lachnospiraceae bacterium]|nr:hypothetical protein [Lachnospiraceae bacterium]
MDWFAKLQLLAIGFICVAYPILLFIMIWSQPTYVIISYFIWIACMLGWICMGEKKKISEFIVPVLIMLLIFTCIYASGYSERDFEEEPFFILATPALSTPAFCYIGYKMAVSRQSKKMEQIRIWIKSLNECYKKKIEGSNKVITLIQNAYSDEKKIERMLRLLDACSGNDLQNCFGKKVIEANQESIVQIKDIVDKYSLPMEFANKTLGDILDEMLLLKNEYKNKIHSEKQVKIGSYKEIKHEYDMVCLRKK